MPKNTPRTRRVMVSIPESVIDQIAVMIDGTEIKSLHHLIQILVGREAANQTERKHGGRTNAKTKKTSPTR